MPKRKTRKSINRRRSTKRSNNRRRTRKTRKSVKRRKTTKKKRSYFKRGNPLNEKQRKYCRCIFHVSGQQTPECLRSKDWGGKCYNPYAVCTASTKRKGSFECFKHIDLNDIPKKELKAMAALKGTTIQGLREKQKKLKRKSISKTSKRK